LLTVLALSIGEAIGNINEWVAGLMRFPRTNFSNMAMGFQQEDHGQKEQSEAETRRAEQIAERRAFLEQKLAAAREAKRKAQLAANPPVAPPHTTAPQIKPPQAAVAARPQKPEAMAIFPVPVDANGSPIWQTAFSLAPNVRFTRTPESTLTKRRPCAPDEAQAQGPQQAEPQLEPQPATAERPIEALQSMVETAVRSMQAAAEERPISTKPLTFSERAERNAIADANAISAAWMRAQTITVGKDASTPQPSTLQQRASDAVAAPSVDPRLVNLSDFAFWDIMPFDGEFPAAVTPAFPPVVNAAVSSKACSGFRRRGEIVKANPGPVVTLYELEPAPGIKSSRVIGLADDIARSMSALSARVAVVPGRNAIGIELPNAHREKVYLRELLGEGFRVDAKLPLCLGKTIGGDPVIIDLARMPHLLIAGTTGSGKSVAINTMILSPALPAAPDQCRLIMVDPKMLELSVYDGIPHLLTPVVTDPKKAVVALKWAVREMEERYKKMSKLGVRNIDGYNQRLGEAKGKGEKLTRTVQTGFDKETGKAIYEDEKLDLEPLPYIVVIVDEMADLMMVAGKDIEGAVQRLAQMARAAGIHVIWRRSVRRSTSSPAPSRRTSRPASPSRSPRRSTAAPSWASRAPSSCSARATCSTWPAAAASAACTARSSPTRRSRRSCAISN
jgi:DNA segregation ATPase FtsK/SpoIIIE-like protein